MSELPPALAEGVDRLLEGVSARDLSRASRRPLREVPPEAGAQRARRAVPGRDPGLRRHAAPRHLRRDLGRPERRSETSARTGAPGRSSTSAPAPVPGLWSAAAAWPSLEQAVAVDAEERMIALGQRLASTAPHPAVRSARWVRATVPEPPPDGPYDLVLLAYVLGELDAADRDRAVDHAAEATAEPAGLTVIVEPGTPEGYARVLRARERLLAARRLRRRPVPARRSLPAARASDWCHFAVRLPRTAAHRAAKHADLGYEDEKYSYVAVAHAERAGPADVKLLGARPPPPPDPPPPRQPGAVHAGRPPLGRRHQERPRALPARPKGSLGRSLPLY